MYSAKVIAVTQPTEEFTIATGAETAEDVISYCARVSNPKNQENFNTSWKLLKYCMTKAHWSVFTMGHVIMEIKCTRDIGRQILRHHFDFQEFSQRYAAVHEPYVVREARLQDPKNRQASIETTDSELQREWAEWQNKVAMHAWQAYDWAVAKGIAKEQARVVLPEGMTPSTMYMGGTVRSWYHYCQIRKRDDTQKEHRLIAKSVWENLQEHFPFLQKIENDNNPK